MARVSSIERDSRQNHCRPGIGNHERKATMATQNERHVEKFVEVSSTEMMQTQGGTAVEDFIKVDGASTEQTRAMLNGWTANVCGQTVV
jgi:hypothetical protein